MVFRYVAHHAKVHGICPPSNYIPAQMTVYRWVFDPINAPNNFISQYDKDPKRFNDKSDEYRCEAMALSMYTDIESAIKKFFYLRDDLNMGKRAYKNLGTKIAVGNLINADGVNESDKTGKNVRKGHFNHHPAINVNYIAKFNIIASFVK